MMAMPTLILIVLAAPAAEDAAELVRRLADPAFAVRERAAAGLLRLGRGAEPALRAGLRDADTEVRRRCRELLDEVLRADREARVQALIDGKDDPKKGSLPCWPRFARLVGSGRAARAAYAGLYRRDAEFLEAADAAPRDMAGRLATRASAVAGELLAADKDEAQLGEMTLLLFVALDERLVLQPAAVGGLANALDVLAHRDALRRSFLKDEASRTLLLAYLRQRMVGASLDRGLELAGELQLKEAADWAAAVALDKAASGRVRGRALLTLARVGSAQVVPRLSGLLEDETPVGDRKLGNVTLHAQVRDVALAVVLRLSGAAPADFGFPYLQAVPGVKYPPSAACLGFATAAERQAAFKRWKDRTGPAK
jgi:hypothetical protein